MRFIAYLTIIATSIYTLLAIVNSYIDLTSAHFIVQVLAGFATGSAAVITARVVVPLDRS